MLSVSVLTETFGFALSTDLPLDISDAGAYLAGNDQRARLKAVKYTQPFRYAVQLFVVCSRCLSFLIRIGYCWLVFDKILSKVCVSLPFHSHATGESLKPHLELVIIFYL